MKIFKPIKRFWRGQTKRMRAALVLFLAVALILVGFGVYLLVRPGESTDGASQTLFEAVDREAVASVLCHTVSGAEYTVKGAYYTVTDAYGDPQTYKRFYLITPDGTEKGYAHEGLSLNASKFSSFIVGTGKNYVYAPVVSAPEAGVENYDLLLAEYEAKKSELGFSENSAYYELTTENGKVYRVWYGIKDVTGDGYYVMLDGDDTVYATKSAFVGDLLGEDGPESLIDSTIFYPSQNTYAYAYPQSYTLTDYVRLTDIGGKKVGDGLYYSVGYTIVDENGKELKGDLPLGKYEGEDKATEEYRNAAQAFFMEKTLGECNEKFTITYSNDEAIEESLRGKTFSFHIKSVDYVTEGEVRFAIKFLPALDRDLSQKLTSYAYSAPADLTSYIPDADFVFSMLEETMGVTGTVVKLGLDDDTLTKYGLYRHQIWFRYPLGSVTTTGSSSSTAESAESLAEQEFFRDDANFIEGRIYVSDVKDGKRYIASLLYELVIEVDAEVFSFLDKDPVEMTDNYVISAQITDVESFRMQWNYGDGKWLSTGYEFDVTVEDVENYSGQKNATVTAVKATPYVEGATLNIKPDAYYELYTRLVYTRYKGSHGLTDAEVDALIADGAKCVLRIDQFLKDGTQNFWEFYPISANRVLVRVKNGSYASPGASFYIYGTALQDIATAYIHMMEGDDFNYEQRYD